MSKPRAIVYIHDGSYHDISDDVISAVRITRGMVDQRPTTRVASPGQVTFTLRNDPGALNGAGTYTTDSANWESWFVRGAHIIVMLQAAPGGGEVTVTKFEGWIKKIDSNYKARTVEVTCYDWLYFAGMKKMPALAGRVSDTALDAITEIKAALLPDGGTVWGNGTNAPGSDDFSPLDLVFMDANIVNYPAIKEITKLITSEFGFLYIGRKHTYEPDANAIIVESRQYRDATDRTLIQAEKPAELCDGLLFEDGSGFLLENGDTLKLNDYEESTLNDEYQDLAISTGNRVYNLITNTYPVAYEYVGVAELWRQTGEAPWYPYAFGSGYSETYQADYSDINNFADDVFVEPANVITPVPNVDFTANAAQDGSGANLTANFTVTITKYLDHAELTVTNTGGTTGYLTLLKLRGGPVIWYFANLTAEESDSTSQDNFGESELSYTTAYQTADYHYPDSVPDQLITAYKDARQIVESVKFIANTSNHTMILACSLDVGSQIRINDTASGINAIYYIDRVDYTIKTNGVIEVEWALRDDLILEEI